MEELFANLMFIFPFLFVGALARELSQEKKSIRYGWTLFIGSALVLAANWFWGYIRSEAFMAQRMWTAAAISYFAVVLRSVPITLVCWVIKERLARRPSTRAEPPVED
jgi:hypothetical protein